MLKVRADISRSVKYGQRVSGKYLTVIFVSPGIIRIKPGESAEEIVRNQPKLTVLVRKKCGCSVKRNRLKRIAREFFRLNQDLFGGCAAVVFDIYNSIDDENCFKNEMESICRKHYTSAKSGS